MMSAYTERIREDRVTTKEDITMKFELARSGNLLIVQVAGELDHHFADEIRMRIDAEIMKPPIRNILFDFNRLSFMDSSGIGMIMGRYKKSKRWAERHGLSAIIQTLQEFMKCPGF